MTEVLSTTCDPALGDDCQRPDYALGNPVRDLWSRGTLPHGIDGPQDFPLNHFFLCGGVTDD